MLQINKQKKPRIFKLIIIKNTRLNMVLNVNIWWCFGGVGVGGSVDEQRPYGAVTSVPVWMMAGSGRRSWTMISVSLGHDCWM